MAAAATAGYRQWRSAASAMEAFRKPFRLYDEREPGCLEMPTRADKYDGVEDLRPLIVKSKAGVVNVFVVGDWGATLPNHITFSAHGGDEDFTQFAVASAMKKRAKSADPQYVLNAGDNFYVQGLEHSCNAPPDQAKEATSAVFSVGWQSIYGELAGIPWLSVLGNHDYGGWRFDKGWPQQIGYSFVNFNWIMPARYFKRRMNHTEYFVDYFMIDSNAWDAQGIGEAGENPDHNICSWHNYGGVSTCASNGGIPSIQECKDWFWRTYAAQKQWLENQLASSDAHWKVVVTHFPCGYDAAYYKRLKTAHGLDLLVTGHRHQQELWYAESTSRYVQSFMQTTGWDGSSPTCLVTGGGGGIVSQKFSYADYGKDLLWYGFFHLTISKDELKIELVDTGGATRGKHTIFPRGTDGYLWQSAQIANGTGVCEPYCGDANNPWARVCTWGTGTWMSCAACPGCKEHNPRKRRRRLK